MENIDTVFKTLVNIHKNSKTPFVIFDQNKKIIQVNSALLDHFFITPDKNEILNFLYIHKMMDGTDFFIPFHKIEIDELLNSEDIFIYNPQKEHEFFYSVNTFPILSTNENSYYYAIINDIGHIEESIMDKSIDALVTASQLKDNDTGNHIKRINEYCHALCSFLYQYHRDDYPEINEYFIDKISKVASMHDVGKIGVPDYILTKPGKLTDDEFQIIKEHTINGAFILSQLAGQMARDIALYHHEKWNGTGYPYGFFEEQIPLSARIVAIADVYDALRMPRSYKESFSHEKTLSIMLADKGKHFDPQLINCFEKITDKFDDIYNSLKD